MIQVLSVLFIILWGFLGYKEFREGEGIFIAIGSSLFIAGSCFVFAFVAFVLIGGAIGEFDK